MSGEMAKGKRVGARRAARKRSLPGRTSLLLCLAITVCVVAWGYLVFAAIDFGTAARDGEREAWAFLGLACVGAAACLFVGLMLGARLMRGAGLLPSGAPEPDDTPPVAMVEPTSEPTRVTGAPTYDPGAEPYRGKRIAR